jgi:mannose-6-phosphate isomerase
MSESLPDLYPLKFSTVYIEKPWGGRTLEKYKGDLPEGLIGETWDVSAQSQGVSQVVNGSFRGRGLDEVVAQLGKALLGHVPLADFFPLMVRHVSSRENLSVQVHPTTEFAHSTGQLSGKDEAWYVLETEPDAFVYAGVSETAEADFKAAVHDGTVRDLLIAHPVAPGDCIFIPAGMIHAICAGVTLIEICENSNTTYRVFDYGRDRGLDFDETFANMNLKYAAQVRNGIALKRGSHCETILCLEPTMAISMLDIDGKLDRNTFGESFDTLTCLSGAGTIEGGNGSGRVAFERGESVVIPAGIGSYTIDGTATVLRSWIPDVPAERERILAHIA